jgi:hypothetical protein
MIRAPFSSGVLRSLRVRAKVAATFSFTIDQLLEILLRHHCEEARASQVQNLSGEEPCRMMVT